MFKYQLWQAIQFPDKSKYHLSSKSWSIWLATFHMCFVHSIISENPSDDKKILFTKFLYSALNFEAVRHVHCFKRRTPTLFLLPMTIFTLGFWSTHKQLKNVHLTLQVLIALGNTIRCCTDYSIYSAKGHSTWRQNYIDLTHFPWWEVI